jgi:bifunctional DNA-binding transcriptional regulator/antitoxin component of YhaV-PrlF toxin-antitoxin module
MVHDICEAPGVTKAAIPPVALVTDGRLARGSHYHGPGWDCQVECFAQRATPRVRCHHGLRGYPVQPRPGDARLRRTLYHRHLRQCRQCCRTGYRAQNVGGGKFLEKEYFLPYYRGMLAKLTSKNQLTLPKKAIEALGAVTHFEVEVEVEGDHLVLTPARLGAGSVVPRKLAEIGITETDVSDAIAWTRRDH